MVETLKTDETGGQRPGEQQPTLEEMSAYYLEIERLLDTVEKSTTHYQMLGIDRSATREEIQSAYGQAVGLLNASQNRFSMVLPDDVRSRVGQALDKLALAFSVLTNFGRRTEYDNSLRQKATAPLAINIQMPVPPPVPPREAPKTADAVSQPSNETPNTTNASPKTANDKGSATAGTAQDAITIKHISMQKEAFSRPIDIETEYNRRRTIRLKLSIPARVTGHDRKSGKWHETTQTIDVSRFGIAVRMHHSIRYGMVLHLTLPLPLKLRSHGYSEPSYKVYAIVRRVEPSNNGERVVGLEFLSERPPPGYLDAPWTAFRTKQWSGAERRRESRKQHSEPVKVRFLDEDMKTIAETEGTTENVSRHGIQIRLKTTPAEFDFVKVIRRRGNFQGVAVVRNGYTSKDGFKRLCLRFMDREWPL